MKLFSGITVGYGIIKVINQVDYLIRKPWRRRISNFLLHGKMLIVNFISQKNFWPDFNEQSIRKAMPCILKKTQTFLVDYISRREN